MVIPAAFVLACAAIVFNAVLRAPKTALVGAALIAAGTPVFLLSRKSSTPIQPVCNEEPEELAQEEKP